MTGSLIDFEGMDIGLDTGFYDVLTFSDIRSFLRERGVHHRYETDQAGVAWLVFYFKSRKFSDAWTLAIRQTLFLGKEEDGNNWILSAPSGFIDSGNDLASLMVMEREYGILEAAA